MEMLLFSMQAIKKVRTQLRFYLKESIIDNQGRRDEVKIQKFKNKNRYIVRSTTRFYALSNFYIRNTRTLRYFSNFSLFKSMLRFYIP